MHAFKSKLQYIAQKNATKCKFSLKMENSRYLGGGCVFNLENGQPFKKLSNGL